jgi:large subunit ribosomal protein L16
MLYELAGVSEEVAREAFRLAGHKLPLACRVARRDELA